MFCCSFLLSWIHPVCAKSDSWSWDKRITLSWRKNLCLIGDRCTFQHLSWASREGARRITASAAAFGENNERANSPWGSVSSLGNRSAWSISVACALWWFCSEWKVSKYVTYWLFCLLMDAPCSIIIVTYAARAPAAVHCPLRGGKTPQPLPLFSLSNPLTIYNHPEMHSVNHLWLHS